MPRFFFHLDNTIEDQEGEEFPTTEDAERHARLVAAELGRNAQPGAMGEEVIVTDDVGRELLRVALDRASTRNHSWVIRRFLNRRW
jgi:Domain of unknown function (DUF6894)